MDSETSSVVMTRKGSVVTVILCKLTDFTFALLSKCMHMPP